MVNDTFTMYLTRLLQVEVHKRLSKEAMSLIEKYGSWYIQLPTFTYLRIQGFTFEPYKLPRYLTDKMVLVEVVRKLPEFDCIKKEKHRQGITFLITLGKMMAICPIAEATKIVNEELELFHLGIYKVRNRFDPFQRISTTKGEKFIHRIDIEDYWVNLTDEFGVRRKIWSRMSVDFMRKCNFLSIPDQLKDDGNHIHPQYAKEKDKPVPSLDWSQPEMVDLNVLMREVNDCSRESVDKKINKLRRQNTTLTYENM